MPTVANGKKFPRRLVQHQGAQAFVLQIRQIMAGLPIRSLGNTWYGGDGSPLLCSKQVRQRMAVEFEKILLETRMAKSGVFANGIAQSFQVFLQQVNIGGLACAAPMAAHSSG